MAEILTQEEIDKLLSEGIDNRTPLQREAERLSENNSRFFRRPKKVFPRNSQEYHSPRIARENCVINPDYPQTRILTEDEKRAEALKATSSYEGVVVRTLDNYKQLKLLKTASRNAEYKTKSNLS